MDIKVFRAIQMRASRIMKLIVNPRIRREDLKQIKIDCLAIIEHIDNAERNSL